MNPQQAYEWLLRHNKEISYLESTRSLLHWDQRTYIPVGGHPHRVEQVGVITRLVHARMTDPKIGEMLAVIEGSDLVQDPLSVPAVNVREWRRSFDRATKIPQEFAVKLAKASAEGETAWQSAKPGNDWAAFAPHLERLVDLKHEEAGLIGFEGGEAYNALLDEYEPGERVQNLVPIFAKLRETLVELLGGIRGSAKRPDTSLLHRHYPVPSQEAFAKSVVRRLGYDFASGRLDVSAHPFTVGIGPGDTRITTRYDEHYFSMAFFGTVHEAGHAIYDQGLPIEHWGTPMGQAISLGIHESQSRTWENLVGRSLGFWKFFYPEAQRHFPALADVPLEAFHFAVNDVHPTLIRTESDEVTYNLHIMLRFELELALMRKELEVSDLPGAWNEKMESYLGIRPPDYAQGVMQDIHWSGGAIGYFPTYTLGNLYAAQFFARAEEDLGELGAAFSRGDFFPFLEWLRTKIHTQGSRYAPRDLVKAVTGKNLTPDYLIDYLKDKFTVLYGI